MIQRLQLQNWRAYDKLDIELGPGATFVVASNGIGKTSLIMAAAWGMFGDIAGVKGIDEIRGEAETATVTVDLRLPSSGALVITRSVDQGGRTQLEASVGNQTIASQEELDQLLADEFGADAHVLAQLTFMIHGGLHETQGEFELRDHLAGLFGVRPLFEAAARAEVVATETASTLRKTMVVERKDKRRKEDLVAELESAEQDLRAAQETRERAVATLNDASERLRAALEWANYGKALDERRVKLTAYAEVAASLLDRAVEPENVVELLTQLEADEERALSELETQAAKARGRADFIRESIAHLETSEAVCPTCLRPFAEHDAERAAEEHARHLESLSETIADAEEQATKQRALLENLKRVLADIRSVPVPAEPSSGDLSGELDAIRHAHDAARDDLQRLDQDVAMRSASSSALRDALEALEHDQEQTSRLEELFRLESLARAAAQSFTETAELIMEQHIEPLVAEVARRWKETFGRGGLQLSADGRITRKIGSRTLSFGALSGGERVWALLVARLLVAGASTRAPFVWLDEPLEHLDPRLRRIVAGTLAMASSRAGLRQVIVTTYEAPIAQQLMEDVPSASLIYVSSSE
jgi:ABC-type transport system involved in cytochrome c biogenesis ATPase subunit